MATMLTSSVCSYCLICMRQQDSLNLSLSATLQAVRCPLRLREW